MSIYEDLAGLFAVNDWKWTFRDKNDKPVQSVPDEDDIQQMLDKTVEALYDGVDGSYIETGRLLIIKTPNGHRVYTYQGDF